MDFDTLHNKIPYVKGGKEKILRGQIYPNVSILMPGRHSEESEFGDFCVCVTDPIFGKSDHQFTHIDIFKDVENRRNQDSIGTAELMSKYLSVINDNAEPNSDHVALGCMTSTTFLQAVQCLAVAEHRRYKRFESKFGGRFLPARFAFGIAEGLWTAADASGLQRKGRPGVEMLEKSGVPLLTRELMS